jgi:hypothetical protein
MRFSPQRTDFLRVLRILREKTICCEGFIICVFKAETGAAIPNCSLQIGRTGPKWLSMSPSVAFCRHSHDCVRKS